MIDKINYLFFVFYLSYVCQALRWTKSGFSVTDETVISMMNVESTPHIDVSSGVQIIIIRNTNTLGNGVYIYCFISGYNNHSQIGYSFCKDKDCYEIKSGASKVGMKLQNSEIDFETNFPNKTGMRVKLNLMSSYGDLSGSYYCKAINNNLAIRSNIIEIRDTIYWSLNLFTKTEKVDKTNVKTISLSSLPQILKCSGGKNEISSAAPKWVKSEFISPMQWSVCPVFKPEFALNAKSKMTFGKCVQYSKDKCEDVVDADICPCHINKIPDWSTYINQDGDLLFTDLRPQSNNKVGSYVFMCYTKNKLEALVPLFYFYDSTVDSSEISKGIFLDGVTKPFSQPLVMISPEKQEFVIYARRIPKEMDANVVKPVAIYALYKASPDIIYTWKLEETILNSNNIMKIDRFMVTFPGDITSDVAGKYTLSVIDKTNKITMEINLKVLGPPILINEKCMKLLVYAWVGEKVAFSCNYKQRPTEITLQINNQDIKLSDSIENSKVNLKKSNPYLEMLSFSMAPTNYIEADTVTIAYNVYNLSKSLGQSQYQDHTVTFIVTNDYGMSVKSTSIYVVPRLQSLVIDFPETFNCTSPCSSLKKQKFKCKIKLEEYAHKELKIEHYWTINSNRIDDNINDSKHMYARYFRVDPITKELTMLPIISNDTDNDKKVKEALKNNFIECNVDIFALDKDESKFMYMSNLDKSLGNSMKARITLDYEPINTAYIYWIVAIILGLLVLIILIVLLTRYCMKNKGETYPLDKLEREHGYDPDKEVQEEMFKPYEREDHDPEIGFGNGEERRLSLTGQSVGSNDDGELDTYDLDPSNFNEDGSIIGKYGANPRDRAVVA